MAARWQRRLVVLVCVYLVVCIWLQTLLPGEQEERAETFLHDPFGSRASSSCHGDNSAHPISVRRSSWKAEGGRDLYPGMCHSHPTRADIQMDEEWAGISAEYPKYVLTVTGWVDTIIVESWRAKPLQVFIVPFSHNDPGWRETYDSYYGTYTAYTLSMAVEKLIENPSWTFVWPEVTYLAKWWETATLDKQTKFKQLVAEGRLEIPTGGWVMTDEASTHFSAMLDQLTEGHLWLKEKLGITVNTSWAIDPFGHSSTMAYLLAQSGIRHLVIQRTHFAVKRHLAHSRRLEFVWGQQWDTEGSGSVFCHMMPFLLYAIAHSCGPNREVCCQFDFKKKSCFYGNKHRPVVPVSDENIDQLAWALWEQLQKKSELYRSSVVLVPHGDDFRYSTASEWTVQLSSLSKLMVYMNSHKDMNIKVQFGTLSDYFNAVNESPTGPVKTTYPVLHGDFFPYSDRGDQYWSGVFTSRPFYKRRVRKLQSLLRSAEIWYSLALAVKLLASGSGDAGLLFKDLQTVRQAHALCQHHDAITGTSTKSVVKDFLKRVHSAIQTVRNLLQTLVQRAMMKTRETSVPLTMTEDWPSAVQLSAQVLTTVDVDRTLVVANPLATVRNDLVTIEVSRLDLEVVRKSSGEPVRYQIGPIIDANSQMVWDRYQLMFEVELQPLSMTSYTVRPSKQRWRSNLSSIKAFDNTLTDLFQGFDVTFSHSVLKPEAEDIQLGNSHILATFRGCDGLLKTVASHEDGSVYRADVGFLEYTTGKKTKPFQDKSGAYIFLPDGPAQPLLPVNPRVIVIEGHLYSSVRTTFPQIVHTATVRNISGPEGLVVHVENLVDMGDELCSNTELVMRVSTDVTNGQQKFCTDSNGFQMLRRTTRKKLTIQGNFYPMTSMAVLEDTISRFSLMTSESHGVASLVTGCVEAVLDRQLCQDDWRGLGEGLKDNKPTRSHFRLLFEAKPLAVEVEGSMCYPSIAANAVSQSLENPVLTFVAGEMVKAESAFQDFFPMLKPLPCSVDLLNFRSLAPGNGGVVPGNNGFEALLVLHRHGLDCFPVPSTVHCPLQVIIILWLLAFQICTKYSLCMYMYMYKHTWIKH